MNGADHFRAAERLLSEASFVQSPSNPRPVTRDGQEALPHVHAAMVQRAMVHATLAQTAATALQVVVPTYGDNDEVTQWAKLLLPDAHLRSAVSERPVPDNWPPRHGDVWEDRHGARWSCQADLTLARLGERADDTATEINRTYGPMQLVTRPDAYDMECPF